MMHFSTRTGLERVGIAGPIRWVWRLDSSTKNKKQRGSAGARPLPLRCLSQSLLGKEQINYFKSEFFAHLSPMGCPGIYSRCFS